MYDIISIGDATLDTFIDLQTAKVICPKQNNGRCYLCLDYAEKTPIYSLIKKVAGNAANNAVGSARLGLKAAFWTIIGEDDTGRLVTATMKKEGVSPRFVQVAKGTESNFTVVLNYQGERTQLVYRQPRDYKLPKLNHTKWIYLTAMGKEYHLVVDDLIKFIEEHNISLAYNPGIEQITCNIDKCKNLISISKVLFVNKEEAQEIIAHNHPNIKIILKKLRALGPEIVVVTDGKNGSYVFDGNDFYHLGVWPAKLVERTGAGDAYATAFVAARFYKKSIEDAMKWGTINSASVIGKIGPQDGLLTLKQMKSQLKLKPRFKAIKNSL
jgi:sugar/nucleoside kinase (ribokinase family)